MANAGGIPGELEELFRAVLREIVREELRGVLRDELGPLQGTAERGELEMPEKVLDAPTYISKEKAAEIANVHPGKVERWVKKGKLPAHYAGRLLRIRLDELVAFLASSDDDRGDVIDIDARGSAILRRIGRECDGRSASPGHRETGARPRCWEPADGTTARAW